MSHIFFASDNIIASRGFSSEENLLQLNAGISGIQKISDPDFAPNPIHVSAIDRARLELQFAELANPHNYTLLEKMFILSIQEAASHTSIDISNNNTLFIFSSTKGNIDLLEEAKAKKHGTERLKLGSMASHISQYFKNENLPVMISNACISGLLGIIIGARFLESGRYENVVVSGGDILSRFTLSGFESLKAIGESACMPYDANRTGITLGEACGTVILTTNKSHLSEKGNIQYKGGASSNDANHISGPSRTGEGLIRSINGAMEDAQLTDFNKIGYISAHGTATRYNDEMESIAFNTLGLNQTPMNSLKGYWGHTLGAAGVIESIATLHSMRTSTLIETKGFTEMGVSQAINVITHPSKQDISLGLKTASGFGGCNAAAIFSKYEN